MHNSPQPQLQTFVGPADMAADALRVCPMAVGLPICKSSLRIQSTTVYRVDSHDKHDGRLCSHDARVCLPISSKFTERCLEFLHLQYSCWCWYQHHYNKRLFVRRLDSQRPLSPFISTLDRHLPLFIYPDFTSEIRDVENSLGHSDTSEKEHAEELVESSYNGLGSG